MVKFEENETMEYDNSEAQMRKERSIELLKVRNIPYIDWLPYIETQEAVKIRTAEEIARRAITCLFSIQVAYDTLSEDGDFEESKAFFEKKLVAFNVKNCLTPKEQKVFDGNCSEQELVDMTWKYEAYWVLLWALGIVKELSYPDKECDCDFAINVVADCDTIEAFMNKVQLRDISEILDEADLIFRYDWACVDARIHGKEAPSGLDSSIVLERHRGLNWLIDVNGDDDWDNVSTNT